MAFPVLLRVHLQHAMMGHAADHGLGVEFVDIAISRCSRLWFCPRPAKATSGNTPEQRVLLQLKSDRYVLSDRRAEA